MRRVRWWHLVDRDEDGLGMIEVLVAIFILSVALTALASVGTSSLVGLRMSRDREQATNAASTAIEDARTNDFDALSLQAGSNPTTLPARVRDLLGVTSSACVDGGGVVADAASLRPIPMVRQSGTNGAHTVYTVVTWARPDGTSTCGATGADMKRVIAVVTWQDGERFNSVRNETLVAPAGRGLPNPNFDAKPSSGALRFTPTQITAGTTRCIEHQVRNLGAGDSYGYEVVGATVAGTTTAFSAAGAAYTLPTAGWQVHAYLEPGSTASRAGDPPSTTTARFTPQAGSPRPVSPLRLESAEQGLLTVCWTPTSTTAANEVAITLQLHSRYDDRRFETLTHTLEIGDPGRRLYLQDWDDLVTHTRGQPGNNDNQLRYRALIMNPLSTAASADRTQQPAPTLLDWSTEIGTVSLPGIRVPRTSQNNPRLDQIEWRYQLPAPQKLLEGATLYLWSAPRNALPNTVPAATNVSLGIELDVLTASDGNNNRFWPTAGPLTWTHSYSHTQGGFQRLEIPLTFTGSPTIPANHRIRVRVTCLPASLQDCNFALDTQTHDSHLLVRLQ